MSEIKRIKVIYSDIKTRGKGEEPLDPIRTIIQIYTLDGELIAEVDPLTKYTMKDIIEFAAYLRQIDPKDVGSVYDEAVKYFK